MGFTWFLQPKLHFIRDGKEMPSELWGPLVGTHRMCWNGDELFLLFFLQVSTQSVHTQLCKDEEVLDSLQDNSALSINLTLQCNNYVPIKHPSNAIPLLELFSYFSWSFTNLHGNAAHLGSCLAYQQMEYVNQFLSIF